MRDLGAEEAFTLVELLLASAIGIAVFAALFMMIRSADTSFARQPLAADVQQRARMAAEALHQDLLFAGAGVRAFAPILPYRPRGSNSDAPGSFRTDVITLVSLVRGCAESTTTQAITRAAADIPLAPLAMCIATDPLCCFNAGMDAIIFDSFGAWDPIAVTAVNASTRCVTRRATYQLTKNYAAGAFVAQAVVRTYYLKADEGDETYELRRYDGDQTDNAVVDNVVGLGFEYFGEPRTPQAAGYGPLAPPIGAVNVDGYATGENCIVAVIDGRQVPRMAELPPGGDRLVKLDASVLSDGPWCPGPSNAGRFDADLLRVRQVRVVLRVQAASSAARGCEAALFLRPGHARGGEMYVPDQVLRFDVTPRNVMFGR